MKELTYHREGDYLIPNLSIKNTNTNYKIGKYGHLRLNFIKEYRRGLYTELMLTATLPNHLIDIDKTANAKIKSIINELAKKENINENLKQTNQLEWIKCMNNIKNRAEEIILNEIIYV